MLHAAWRLTHARSGNFTVMFALILPVIATVITFIGDQAKIGQVQSRVREAREAAAVAEYMRGNKSKAQLEAYAKDFFIANLGKEYEKAADVKLIVSGSPSKGLQFDLETHVKYEPFLAPVYAAASGNFTSSYAVDIH
jgi:Flp pilus assembly protein TadG